MTTSEREQIALENFSGKMNCAQSVLLAFENEIDIDREALMRIGSALGAGMGQGEVCGAVSGALIVLGLLSRDYQSPEALKTHVGELSKLYKENFEDAFGSLLCKDLLGIDLKDDKNYDVARAQNVFHEICPGFIRKSIKILEEVRGGNV
jgi:C_GCAxxG_C_C family probable redox protein